MPRNIRSLVLGLVYTFLALFVWWNRTVIFGFSTDLGGDAEVAQQALAAGFPLVDLSKFTTGEVLLGFLGLLTLLYVIFAAGIRTSSLVEIRRYSKEVEAARKLADEAEASRILDLKQHIDGALAELRETSEAHQSMLVATLGQMEDRMDRAGLTGAAPAALPEPAEHNPDDAPVD